MSDFDRAVVFLDPYATEVSWMTVEEVAKTKKIDCWILFPLMAVARMMPTDKEPNEAWARRLDRIFGDRQHWQQSYHDSPQFSLKMTRDDNAQRGANRLRIDTGNACARCSTVSLQPGARLGTQRRRRCSNSFLRSATLPAGGLPCALRITF